MPSSWRDIGIALMNSLQLWLPEQDQDKILNFPAGSINWTQRVIQKKSKQNNKYQWR